MTDAPPARPLAPQGRAAPLLPPDAGRDRPLFAVAAILVFLACLAALGARGAWTATDTWMAQLEGGLTLQVRVQDGRDADADARQAAEIAAAMPGVMSAEARSRAQSAALLEPWLGSGELPADLPVPLLVDVRLERGAAAPIEALAAALAEAGIVANIDDHGRFADAVARSARTARLLAIGLLMLISGAAAAVVAFAARASLAARRDVADALHLVGAPDAYIARLFELRFFFLGLKAGAAGAFFALLTAILVSAGGGGAGDMAYFMTSWAVRPVEMAALLAAPPLAGLISALSARLAVAEDLRRRW